MPVLQLRPIVVGDAKRSPAYEDGEAKDQDRATWVPLERGGVACVCDGTSSSWRAAEAAEVVTDLVKRQRGFWPETAERPIDSSPDANDWFLQNVDWLVTELLYRRTQGQRQPIKLPNLASEGEREIREESIRNLRRTGYQTTLLVARLDYFTEGKDTALRIRHFKIGDSELFVFAPDGRLLETTSALVWDRSQALTGPGPTPLSRRVERPVRFLHTTATDVLPDALLTKVPRFGTIFFDADVSVLLTSDGMIDAFDGPAELAAWLLKHAPGLDSKEALDDLHRRLQQRGGDDDISFVWVPPPADVGGRP